MNQRNILMILLCLAIGLNLGVTAHAKDDPKARQIMEDVNNRDDGDNATSDMEMILIDRRGNERVREIRSFSKDFDEDEYRIMFFLSPADVRNTSFLTYDYDDESKDDDQWLYLPALNKVKRIASSDKDGSFMGSDFTYGDMTDTELSKYNFELLQEMEVRGHPCWVIKSTPRSEDVVDTYGYTQTVVWVRQDNNMVVRAKFWLDKGGKNKYLDVVDLEVIDGIWTAKEMHMTTKKGDKTEHKTVLKFHNTKYNQDLDPNMFTTRRMEMGL